MNDAVAAYRLLIADVFELAGTSRATSEQLAARKGQTAARWHVMSAVSDGAMSVPAIARRLGQSRQSVQRVTNDLHDEGLVELRTNPDHARSPLVALTPRGADTVTSLFADSEQIRADLLAVAGVTDDELEAARGTLRRLLDAFGQRDGDDGS